MRLSFVIFLLCKKAYFARSCRSIMPFFMIFLPNAAVRRLTMRGSSKSACPTASAEIRFQERGKKRVAVVFPDPINPVIAIIIRSLYLEKYINLLSEKRRSAMKQQKKRMHSVFLNFFLVLL